jgi:hypothetical protein
VSSEPSESFEDHWQVQSGDVSGLTDRQLAEQQLRLLAHLDVMLHEVHQLASRAAPLLDKWGGFLSNPIADYRRARREARRG